jgi:hypothetical protein
MNTCFAVLSVSMEEYVDTNREFTVKKDAGGKEGGRDRERRREAGKKRERDSEVEGHRQRQKREKKGEN